MKGEYVELNCPFCEKGRMVCLYFPSVWSEKRSLTATFGSRRTRRKTSETWIIQSGCNICGKSREEVEKELKRLGIIRLIKKHL